MNYTKIKVEHEVPIDKTRCIYDGDFWGNEICPYHKYRDRTHGRKAPPERNKPRCTLFNCWLDGRHLKCEACKKACEESEE